MKLLKSKKTGKVYQVKQKTNNGANLKFRNRKKIA